MLVVAFQCGFNACFVFWPFVAGAGFHFFHYYVAFFLLWFAHGLAFEFSPIHDPLQVLIGLSLAPLLGTCLGSVFCALSVVSNTVDRIIGPMLRPMFWISGLFFSLNELPLAIRELLLWNPVLHCVELVRGGTFESYDARHADPGYVLTVALGFAFVGLTLERRVRHKIQV